MIKHLHGNIVVWLEKMGQLVKKRMAEGISVETKTSLSDLVTNVDKEIEENFINYIQTHYPNHSIIGEESFTNRQVDTKGYVWVIDPIDGTLNFVKEHKNFAIMLGLFVDGIGQLGYVYDVMADKLYYAIRGEGAFCNNQPLPRLSDDSLSHSLISMSSYFIDGENHRLDIAVKRAQGRRMIGSASHSMIALFNGHHHAYIASRLNVWDYMPALPIAEELGLRYVTWNGEDVPLWQATPLIIGTPLCVQEIVTSTNA